jgi:hypothetical protein
MTIKVGEATPKERRLERPAAGTEPSQISPLLAISI